jgi:ABC-type multidrug transport system fused ATPase/permease subunit
MQVRLSDFLSYFRAYGACLFFTTLAWYLIYLAAQTGSNIWLSMWSSDPPPEGNATQDTSLRDLRLGVYGALGGVQAIGVLGQSFAAAVGCVSASRVLHNNLLNNIMRAPMYFFDTTPLGRIVNRFARDMDIVDVNIPVTMRIWTGTFASVISTVFVISYSTPIFLAVVIPLGLFYYFVQVRLHAVRLTHHIAFLLVYFQRFYITTSRQLRRIDSILRSPIYTHFEASLTGASSIRAYDQSEKFVQYSDMLLDKNQMAYYPFLVSNRSVSDLQAFKQYSHHLSNPQMAWILVGNCWKSYGFVRCNFCHTGKGQHLCWLSWIVRFLCTPGQSPWQPL